MDNSFLQDFSSGQPTQNPVERTLNPASAIRPRNEYLRVTTTFTYSFLFTLPLFIMYEAGIRIVNAGSPIGVRISADIMIKRLLELIGLNGTLPVALFVLVLGIAVILYERRHNIPLRPRYFGFMLAESTLYAIVLGMLVSMVVTQVFGIMAPALQIGTGPKPGLAQNLVLSLGAGLYEELVFRLFLVSLLYAILKLFTKHNQTRYTIAVIVGALIFSWVHYVGNMGDVFTLSSFTFRFLMGLALNGLFVWRGFGVAAMTHSLYDVFVTLLNN